MSTEMETETERQKALVLNAKARAIILHLLTQSESVFVYDDFLPALKEIDYPQNTLPSLMERMAVAELIRKVPIVHHKYKVGFVDKDVSLEDLEVREDRIIKMDEIPQKRSCTRRTPTAAQVQGKELPLDIRINEKEQTLTIRAMGLRITIGKE